MAWCGVVWCGVVWCDVAWCGVAWHGLAWCCLGRKEQAVQVGIDDVIPLVSLHSEDECISGDPVIHKTIDALCM